MPLSLWILESREKKCVDKIQSLKEQAFAAGAEEIGTLKFDLSLYLKSLTDAKDEELAGCLSLAENLPKVLEFARQATEEEVRRRKYQSKISKIYKERNIRMKQMLREQKKRQKRKDKQLTRMKAASSLKELQETEEQEVMQIDSSQWLDIFFILFLVVM